MGADRVEDRLRPLLAAVRDAGHPVVWACDPMHAQHVHLTSAGTKTRHFDDIVREIGGFFRAHRAEGTWPGGIHVELTGDDVTECLGGAEEILDEHLDRALRDGAATPASTAASRIDLAFRVAELLRDGS